MGAPFLHSLVFLRFGEAYSILLIVQEILQYFATRSARLKGKGSQNTIICDSSKFSWLVF